MIHSASHTVMDNIVHVIFGFVLLSLKSGPEWTNGRTTMKS